MRHRRAYPENPTERAHRRLETGGSTSGAARARCTCSTRRRCSCSSATRSRQYDVFEQYTQTVDKLSEEAATLRGLFTLKNGVREPVPLEEVEPVSEIVKRFSTGAMSYGSISQEAHQTLAP